MIARWRDDPRQATNPIFGSTNRMKLGVFSHNGTGPVQTTAPDAYQLSWPVTLSVSQAADRAGLEAVVPYARWKGYLDHEPAHRAAVVFDAYAWAAGIAQATEQAGVFCTSHVPNMHPIVAAKQCATIDHISGGRMGLNVVAGWNKPEFDMFGTQMREHHDRYDQAAEWVDILRRLWTEDGGIDFEGQYYRIEKAISLPHPIQKPFPALMNAGGSGKGREFAAKYADMVFVMLRARDVAGCRAEIDAYRDLARDQFGRDIQVWSFATVAQRDTLKEAEAHHRYYSETYLDEPAIEAFMALQGMHTQMFAPDQFEAMKSTFGGGGGYPLIGTPTTIVDSLAMLADAGLDGMLLTWFDYADGLGRWIDGVTPVLEQAGLRAPRS